MGTFIFIFAKSQLWILILRLLKMISPSWGHHSSPSPGNTHTQGCCKAQTTREIISRIKKMTLVSLDHLRSKVSATKPPSMWIPAYFFCPLWLFSFLINVIMSFLINWQRMVKYVVQMFNYSTNHKLMPPWYRCSS